MSLFRLIYRVIFFVVFLFLIACDKPPEQPQPETALEHAGKHLNASYVCPMHPQVIKDESGDCPICGMTLVEKKPTALANENIVTLDNRIIQLMGVRTASVIKGSLQKQVRALGKVAYDQQNVTEVRSSTYGWVENLGVKRVGLQVKRGQLLMELYSPEYLTAQKQFLKDQKKDQSSITKKYGQRSASIQSRDHLRYLNASESRVNEITRTGKIKHRLPIYAPQFGVLIAHHVHKHQFVDEDTLLLTIADLTTVWVDVEVAEPQIQWIKRGLNASLSFSAFPSKTWRGRINYIYPELDGQTHALKVRLVVRNFSGELKPNMLANVLINAAAKQQVLKVPTEAVIKTGERVVVIIALGDGRFKPVDVIAGLSSQGETEIISGLKEADKVVTSGQFLIDSEANIQARLKQFEGSL